MSAFNEPQHSISQAVKTSDILLFYSYAACTKKAADGERLLILSINK
jgi:co-chaperonin GroES (HSP10)